MTSSTPLSISIWETRFHTLQGNTQFFKAMDRRFFDAEGQQVRFQL